MNILFKKHHRILALCSGKISLKSKIKVPIVAVLWRNPYIEKVYIKETDMDVSPKSITDFLIELVDRKLFENNQIKLVIIYNTILAGISLIDINLLNSKWNVPLLFISDKTPEINGIIEVASKKSFNYKFLSVLNRNPKNWTKLDDANLYFLQIGMSELETVRIIESLQQIGNVPEPLRVAKLIAQAASPI